MNFSQLHCFVALANAGRFTETAYTTHLTQSAVSHALAALERELGVTLLECNNKGEVALTGIGRSLLPHARALLAQAEAIEQGAQAARGLVKGICGWEAFLRSLRLCSPGCSLIFTSNIPTSTWCSLKAPLRKWRSGLAPM